MGLAQLRLNAVSQPRGGIVVVDLIPVQLKATTHFEARRFRTNIVVLTGIEDLDDGGLTPPVFGS